MDIKMIGYAILAALVINIFMLTSLTQYIVGSVPFDMDIIREQVLSETKYLMRDSCLHGIEFRKQTEPIPWGGPYPVQHCNDYISGKEQYLYELATRIGLKRRE